MKLWEIVGTGRSGGYARLTKRAESHYEAWQHAVKVGVTPTKVALIETAEEQAAAKAKAIAFFEAQATKAQRREVAQMKRQK